MKKLGLIFLFVLLLYGCNFNGETDLSIESVESHSSLEGMIYSEAKDLDLPTHVSVTLSDGSIISVPVQWEDKVFDTLGSTTLVGDLELNDTVSNPQQLHATISINVISRLIIDMLEIKGNYSTLVLALQASELDRVLSLEGPYTLFAPTDEAFETLLTILDINLENFLERDDLEAILLYHLLTGNYSENVLIAAVPGTLTTLEGATIDVRLQGARVEINQSSVVQESIQAKNGWIHKVDRVLVSQSTVDSVIDDIFGNDVLEMFLDVLLESGLPLDILLTGSATVFVPNEDAFTRLLEDLDVDIEGFIMLDGAVELLSYHIFAGSYLADQLYNDAPINIRNIRGDLLRVEVVEGNLMIKDIQVQSTETFGEFGLVHIIDGVLIPPHLQEAWFPND